MTYEIRRCDDGAIDEVVADSVQHFHLEQMSDGHWWMAIKVDGVTLHINLHTKRGAKIMARAEYE